MATALQLTWTPSGSKKTNAAARTLTSDAPAIVQSNGRFRTVTTITRKNGLYCTCGGTVQSVVIEVYDQLIDASTGAALLTSTTATCVCRGTGPSSENIATTRFENIGAQISRKLVAAWAAGVLQIKRTATIKSYTSPNHGTPYFRSGYYDDVITIDGTTAAYDPSITISAFDAGDEALLYASSWAQRPLRFTVNTAVAESGNWENANALYRRLDVKMENLSGGSAPGTVSAATTTATSTGWSVSSTALTFTRTNGFNRGNRYRVTFTLSVGSSADDLSETASDDVEIDVAAIPLHLSKHGHGVGIGMYSAIDPEKDAAGADSRMDCNLPAHFHAPMSLEGGIERLGSGWTYLSPAAGSTPAEYGGGALRCRAMEKLRVVDGSLLVKPGSDKVVLATLPEGYTPTKNVFSLNACSGGRVARVAVGGARDTNAGKLCLEWVKNLSDGANYTSAAIWVQCSIDYWVD